MAGTKADVRIRAEATHRRRQDVRSGMAQHRQRLRVLVGEHAECTAVPQWRTKILHGPVHADRNGRIEQAFADARDDLLGSVPDGTSRTAPSGRVRRSEADAVSGISRWALQSARGRSLAADTFCASRSRFGGAEPARRQLVWNRIYYRLTSFEKAHAQ